jgi:predicted negative regulator of RcsB-dependent stress response
MAYDLEEQEQIDELKDWWNRHGTLVIAVVAAILISVSGYQGWNFYKGNQAVAAVTLYEELVKAELAGEHKKVRDLAAQIADRYGATAYAGMAALAAARSAFTSGDLGGAKAHLEWVLGNAREEEMKDVARLRMAGVLLDEKKHEEALKLLDTKPVESLAGLYADLRGDVLTAQGRSAEARAAYQLALDKSEAGSAYRATIQLKLDALGDAAPAGKS